MSVCVCQIISVCQFVCFTVPDEGGGDRIFSSSQSVLKTRLITFRRPYVQMFFVLDLVTVMSSRESYWLLFVPELVQSGRCTIYAISSLTLPVEQKKDNRLEAENFNQLFCSNKYQQLTLFIFVTLNTWVTWPDGGMTVLDGDNICNWNVCERKVRD